MSPVKSKEVLAKITPKQSPVRSAKISPKPSPVPNAKITPKLSPMQSVDKFTEHNDDLENSELLVDFKTQKRIKLDNVNDSAGKKRKLRS